MNIWLNEASVCGITFLPPRYHVLYRRQFASKMIGNDGCSRCPSLDIFIVTRVSPRFPVLQDTRDTLAWETGELSRIYDRDV